MKLLAIDTSTHLASVALATGGELFVEEQDAMRQHAQTCLPMIETLFLKANLDRNAIDGVVFGCGPGSFTGLRIACSIAKSIAYAHDLPIYPVSTLQAIAFEAHQKLQTNNTPILAVLDARMNQLYWGLYKSMQAQNVEEHVSDASDVIAEDSSPITLAGIGFDLYESSFPEETKKNIQSRMTIYPHAKSMINLVQAGHITATSAENAMPVYIRNQVTHGATHG